MSADTFEYWLQTSFPNLVVLDDDTYQLEKFKIRYLNLNSEKVVNSLGVRGNHRVENLIYIYSDEWDKRQSQCKSIINSKLRRASTVIGARECSVTEIHKETACEFMDLYHIQGSNKLGLVYFGLLTITKELIAVLSLGRHGRQIAQNRIVLDRLCFKHDTHVPGGASKLLSAASTWAKDRKYDEIISFSDNRWSNGEVYKKLGFELDQNQRSDYLYVKDGIRISKQSQKKTNTNCPESITEKEWASIRGLKRIFDCGKKRWILNINPENWQTRKDKNSQHCAKQHQSGKFKHSHIRGYFKSNKNQSSIYFGSSYELRCLFLLENNPEVILFKRAETFKGVENWRNPDIEVTFIDNHSEIWEVKPEKMLQNEAVIKQITDSKEYSVKNNKIFRIWTEKDSLLSGEHEIIEWAKQYLKQVQNDPFFEEKSKNIRKIARRKRYEKNIMSDKVDIFCEYCKETHTALRLTYKKNIKKNGQYICERYGGHLAGSKPKPSLWLNNPYASENKKQCGKCKEILPIKTFSKRSCARDGLAINCKICRKKSYIETEKTSTKTYKAYSARKNK